MSAVLISAQYYTRDPSQYVKIRKQNFKYRNFKGIETFPYFKMVRLLKIQVNWGNIYKNWQEASARPIGIRSTIGRW